MDLEEAIRTRRTHKAYGSEPVDRGTLTELLDLGRWAPNHHLTNPWRFRVVGPDALQRLKEAVGEEGASKLDRAPTLVAVSYVTTPGDPVIDEEDLLAAGAAAYAILLGAHARGLAAYWRTPAILRDAAGRAALSIPETERCIALLHLGPPRQEPRVPERAPLDDVLTFLD
ncbi:nitroreductase family protein [Baekduia sp. Peel2402]|uniref:nitroreductase family protein n=1 Tax=Baekduia sp. Peel2402 TaxID=3458296 RepID=UPI00403EE44E